MYCKDSELLSEGVDEWLTCRPLLTRAVIAAMALHLANAITDAFRRGAVGFSPVRRVWRNWLARGTLSRLTTGEVPAFIVGA
jgi:hypothetical protein